MAASSCASSGPGIPKPHARPKRVFATENMEGQRAEDLQTEQKKSRFQPLDDAELGSAVCFSFWFWLAKVWQVSWQRTW